MNDLEKLSTEELLIIERIEKERHLIYLEPEIVQKLVDYYEWLKEVHQ